MSMRCCLYLRESVCSVSPQLFAVFFLVMEAHHPVPTLTTDNQCTDCAQFLCLLGNVEKHITLSQPLSHTYNQCTDCAWLLCLQS